MDHFLCTGEGLAWACWIPTLCILIEGAVVAFLTTRGWHWADKEYDLHINIDLALWGTFAGLVPTFRREFTAAICLEGRNYGVAKCGGKALSVVGKGIRDGSFYIAKAVRKACGMLRLLFYCFFQCP